MARKLRIAVSVFFMVLTAALMAMCVRSYWKYEYISRHVSTSSNGPGVYVACISNHGYLTIYRADMRLPHTYAYQINQPAIVHWTKGSTNASGRVPATFLQSSNGYIGVNVPYSYLAAVTVVGAALPYFVVRRYSVRTLLIATTLVAVVLGLAVWAGR